MNTTEPISAPYTPTTTQPVTIATAVSVQPYFGEEAVSMFCPYCQQGIITEPNYTTGTMTWLASGIVCFAGGFAGCCLIPFVIDSCKDVCHSCPKCDRQLGLYKRL